MLEGEPDDEVWAAAIAHDRALVSENVQDFRPIEANALAHAQPVARLTFTTDRQFPRGDPTTLGRLGSALDALLGAEPDLATTLFLTCDSRITTRLGVAAPADQRTRTPTSTNDPPALAAPNRV
jgi:Domain of unknown function (DUF5615)